MHNWNVRITIPAEESSALHAELAYMLGLDDPLTELLNRASIVEAEVEAEVEANIEEVLESPPAEVPERIESQVSPTCFSYDYSAGAFRVKFECSIPNIAPLNAFVSDLSDTWPNEITVEAISSESGQAMRAFMRKGLYHGLYSGDIFKGYVSPELRSFITEMTSFSAFYEYPKFNRAVEEKSEVETLDMPKSTATITHASNNTIEA